MVAESEAPKESESGGGTSGDHVESPVVRLRLAPTDGDAFNTFSLGFWPIACWRMDDVRFAFDSSFLLPEARHEFRRLRRMVAARPGHKVSLFAHADPTGTDDYNKLLSGRRAVAVYAVLVRRTDFWEGLYGPGNALGRDLWATKQIQIMLTALKRPSGEAYYAGAIDGVPGPATNAATRVFQADQGLPVTGTYEPPTRKKLFEAYMELLCTSDEGVLKLQASDFLAGGADAQGKGDYQGCGEFNPVLIPSEAEHALYQQPLHHDARDFANEPNRRVLVYFFPPGLTVTPSTWPCPTVKEGVANCKKRFWSDAGTRRTPTEARRTFAVDRNTFACRFYHRLAMRSPCEATRRVTQHKTMWLGMSFDDGSPETKWRVRDEAESTVREEVHPTRSLADQALGEPDEHDLSEFHDSKRYFVEVTVAGAHLSPRMVLRPAALRRALRVGDLDAVAAALQLDFTKVLGAAAPDGED